MMPPHISSSNLDPKVLGQLLASENIINILPTEQKIGEFTVAVIKTIPGVSGCKLCIKGIWIEPEKGKGTPCARCGIRIEKTKNKSKPACLLPQTRSLHSISIETTDYFWGYLFIQPGDEELFNTYQMFVRNFCNQVAVHLENRQQRNVLRIKNEELQKRH